MSRNCSRVAMEPKMWPQTSFEACILRAIFRVHSCGTWQSGQPARTPERLVKWTVPWSSSNTLSRISWQPTQKVVLLVASSAMLKPPQNTMPIMNPPSVRKARLRPLAGDRAVLTTGRPRNHPHARPILPRRPPSVAPGAGAASRLRHQRLLRPPDCRSGSVSASMSVKRFSTSGRASVCGTWQARQA